MSKQNQSEQCEQLKKLRSYVYDHIRIEKGFYNLSSLQCQQIVQKKLLEHYKYCSNSNCQYLHQMIH